MPTTEKTGRASSSDRTLDLTATDIKGSSAMANSLARSAQIEDSRVNLHPIWTDEGK